MKKENKKEITKMNLDVKKARETLFRYGISGTEFAQRFGIHRSFVYNTMNGVSVPGRKFFSAWAKFCKLYGLDFLDFFIFDEE